MHLSTQQASLGWQESITKLSDPPWLAKHLLVWSSKSVLDSLSEWRSSVVGSGSTWGPEQGGGALGVWAGLWVSSAPQTPLGALFKKRWWHMIEAQLSLLGLVSVQVTPGLLLSFAPGEK